jgi:hypothetical protein
VIFGGQVVEEIAGTDADEATLLRAAYHLRSGAQLPEELVAAGAAGTATTTPTGAAEAVEAAEVASPVGEARAAERPPQAAGPADVAAPEPADPAQHPDEAGS